ncbi:substrate-binding periplasmic protein [Emcibacter sp.]|uniref:substrate-binding periplasmic protein n=1 Tax=Emcibacter sp. TaxID=1979954 RepID=UPI003A8E9138
MQNQKTPRIITANIRPGIFIYMAAIAGEGHEEKIITENLTPAFFICILIYSLYLNLVKVVCFPDRKILWESYGRLFLAFRIFSIISLFFMPFSLTMVKAEELSVVTIQLGPGLQEPGEIGLYDTIFNAVTEKAQVHGNLQIHPLSRALRIFEEKKASCFWTADEKLAKQLTNVGDDLLEGLPFLKARQRIVTLEGQPVIISVSQLSGKNVAVTRGSNIRDLLENADVNVIAVPEQEHKVRMLLRGRLDAILTWTPDIYVILEKLAPGTKINVSPLVFTTTQVRLVCHKSPETVSAMKKIDQAIASYRGSQNFLDIFRKFGVPEGGLDDITLLNSQEEILRPYATRSTQEHIVVPASNDLQLR